MGFVDRLQTYLRHAAQTSYDVVPIPPFTAFFHPTDDLTFFNYAIPDRNVTGDVTAALQELRAAFQTRHRRPRWEYLDEFAPELASILRAASAGGFGAPYDGISEIVGIATRAHFRRRGIASALTALATQTAFDRGVEIACLTAGDERAGRVYERIGYQPTATTLFYIDPEEHDA